MELVLELLCTAYEGILSHLIGGIKRGSKKTEKVIRRVLKIAMWVLFAMLFAGIFLVSTSFTLIGGVILATATVLLFTQLVHCALFYKKR